MPSTQHACATTAFRESLSIADTAEGLAEACQVEVYERVTVCSQGRNTSDLAQRDPQTSPFTWPILAEPDLECIGPSQVQVASTSTSDEDRVVLRWVLC